MPPLFKKTKIIATIGPASESEKILRQLIDAGMNVARLNFSHGTHEEHKKRIDTIRQLAKKLHKPIGIIQDLQGPKIRLGILQHEPLLLKKDQILTLCFANTQTDEKIPVQTNIFPYVQTGNDILINDGIIRIRVKSKTPTSAVCQVIDGGEIRSHKGINLPHTVIPNASLTEKDIKDLSFGLLEKVDYIALSFVQKKEDIQQLRKILEKNSYQPKIIVKIECGSAIDHLEEIILASDVVMVARGDLAVEIGQEEVPLIQRRIIELCRKYAKPVIVATQMLESMVVNAQPTRAEVNDVATAVMDEVDAVMLSAESAQGNYPTESVQMMDRIIRRIEAHASQLEKRENIQRTLDSQLHAIAFSSDMLANAIQAKVLLALTQSGTTAIELSRFRPHMPIISLSDSELTCNQLSLVWGVKSIHVKKIKNNLTTFAQGITIAKEKGILKKNDKVVLVGGTNPGISGHINTIQVETVT